LFLTCFLLNKSINLDLKINENLTIPLLEIERGKLFYEFCTVFSELTTEPDKRFPYEIRVKVNVEKVDKDYLIRLQLFTEAHLKCDRCNEEFDKKISEKITFLCTFEKEKAENQDSDEIKLLHNGVKSITITQEVLDLLLLSISQKVLCKKDCKGLCSKCGANLNKVSCKCKKDTIDPRWNKLKNINFDD